MKFYEWYCEALGCVLGMLTSIYCYIRGDLLLYSNLVDNYDALTFGEVIASYILYPLCFIVFIISILIALKPNVADKKFIGINVKNIAVTLKYLICIVGIIGCNIFFSLAIFVLLIPNIVFVLTIIKNKLKTKFQSKKYTPCYNDVISSNNELINDLDLQLFEKGSIDEEKLLSTKKEIAIQLLDNNSNMDFISEISGLSLDYINKLKKEALNTQEK